MLFDLRPSVVVGDPTAAPLSPLELYGRLLAAGPRGGAGSARLRHADGRLEPLALQRWLAPASPVDRVALRGVAGPVLDVGCGPGRLLAALDDVGESSLGIDVSPVAVGIARRGGARAMVTTVFDPTLDEASWATVLLMDGNVGIGGRPARLLARSAALLRPGGRIIAELEAPGTGSHTVSVRLEWGEHVSQWFSWSRVDEDGIAGPAATAGLRVEEVLGVAGRHFARLVHRS